MTRSKRHIRHRKLKRSRRMRRGSIRQRPLVAFILIASFGILFAGCSSEDQKKFEDEFTFTEQDIERMQQLKNSVKQIVPLVDTETGSEVVLRLDESEAEAPVLDLSMQQAYEAVRSGPGAVGANLYRVTNEFLNVRAAPRITANAVERLVQGDLLSVVKFVDAAWAEVQLADETTGFVAQRYIAKLVSEENLEKEREEYKNTYFVDFGFLNVRKAPDTNSEKLGELPGQSFVTVLSQDDTWARVPFEGGEGYVAREYLSPFLPNFLTRQEKFTLPVLHYQLHKEGLLDVLPGHLSALKDVGMNLMTLADFRSLLLRQEERDVRLEPSSVVLAISGVNGENITAVSDLLRASNVNATLFLQTSYIGLSGINENTILTLLANGHDIQSAAHTGDDLRSLTNVQLELELQQSRKILEEKTARDIFAIGYPIGGVNERVEAKSQEAGYLLGLSAYQGRSFDRSQLLRIPTLSVTESATSEDVLGLVKGE